jgi:uncharacterized UBP type Zn finger protein
MADKPCQHQDQIKEVTPSGDGCKECLQENMEWVALRLCLSCGHVGCCDSSAGKHARGHYESTNHPIIESYKAAAPGATEWRWCYIDNAYL